MVVKPFMYKQFRVYRAKVDVFLLQKFTPSNPLTSRLVTITLFGPTKIPCKMMNLRTHDGNLKKKTSTPSIEAVHGFIEKTG